MNTFYWQTSAWGHWKEMVLNCLITSEAQALTGYDDGEIWASSVVPDVNL